MTTDVVATLAASLIEKDRAIDAAITALGELKADVLRLQRERDGYRQALVEVHDRACEEFDGDEDTVHGPYMMIAGTALGLIP
jgi:hypothetical protein